MSLTDKQKEELEYLVKWKGYTVKDACLCIPGITYSQGSKYARRVGLKPIYKDKEWLQKQYDELITTKAICEKYGFSSDTLYQQAKKLEIVKHPDIKSYAVRKYTVNEKYFEVIDTPEKAYWLGFIMADGSISKSSKDCPYNRLDILLKDDESEELLLNSFLKDINSNSVIQHRIIKNKKKDFESDELSVRINSKIFVSHLIESGIEPNKTGKENFPDKLKDFYRDFIRGFFDGDGCIKRDGRISIGSASYEILNCINAVVNVYLNFEFWIYERTEYNVPFYLIESSHRERNKKFLSWLYDNSTRYLKRKRDLYLSL